MGAGRIAVKSPTIADFLKPSGFSGTGARCGRSGVALSLFSTSSRTSCSIVSRIARNLLERSAGGVGRHPDLPHRRHRWLLANRDPSARSMLWADHELSRVRAGHVAFEVEGGPRLCRVSARPRARPFHR